MGTCTSFMVTTSGNLCRSGKRPWTPEFLQGRWRVRSQMRMPYGDGALHLGILCFSVRLRLCHEALQEPTLATDRGFFALVSDQSSLW
jgi:hypothetical protein